MNVNRSGNDNNGRNAPSASQDSSQQEQSGRPKKSVRNQHEVMTAVVTPESHSK